MKKLRSLVVILSLLFILQSCSNTLSLPTPETITRMNIIVKNNTTQHIDTFSLIQFRPNPVATRDTVRLSPYSTYAVQIKLLNEATNPIQVVSDTITALADIHLMVIAPDPIDSLLSVHILDKDSKGLPLGLLSTIRTTAPRQGFLHLDLRHQPGAKNGTETPGQSDFQADFPVLIR